MFTLVYITPKFEVSFHIRYKPGLMTLTYIPQKVISLRSPPIRLAYCTKCHPYIGLCKLDNMSTNVIAYLMTFDLTLSLFPNIYSVRGLCPHAYCTKCYPNPSMQTLANMFRRITWPLTNVPKNNQFKAISHGHTHNSPDWVSSILVHAHCRYILTSKYILWPLTLTHISKSYIFWGILPYNHTVHCFIQISLCYCKITC